jgi:hypothetical protein
MGFDLVGKNVLKDSFQRLYEKMEDAVMDKSDKAALSELLMQQDINGKIFSPNLNKFYTDFQHTMNYSDGKIDTFNVQLTGSLTAGTNSIVVPAATGLSNGMELSVQDASSYEDVVISSIGTGVVDHSTALNVVGNNYSTLGNGGRKLVRLSNGWFVCVAWDGTGHILNFYVSKDNGSTWSLLCYAAWNPSLTYNESAICCYGTKVICITNATLDTNVYTYKFDATTISGSLPSAAYLDSSQTSFGPGVSIEADSTGVIHAVWSSKNATYPNSYNIRYAKSTDGGSTWSAPTQVTVNNTSGVYVQNPSVVIKNNVPLIL